MVDLNGKLLLRITIVFLLFHDTLCLRDVRIVVPEAVERWSRVEMKCLYNLEQDVLYSVKWYRGDREFCRYSPRDVPPLKIFPIPGIEVDKDATDSERLTIASATRTAGGRYTCEVSADAPSFQTAQVHAVMYVVDLPESGPTMQGLKRRYRPGMKLKVECISRNSMPAANLSFFINSEPASSQHVWHRVEVGDNGRLMTAYSTIQFVVQSHHFIRGKIKVRCTANMYSIYLRSLEKSAEEERIRTTPVSLPEVHEAIVYSIHRLPETNATIQDNVVPLDELTPPDPSDELDLINNQLGDNGVYARIKRFANTSYTYYDMAGGTQTVNGPPIVSLIALSVILFFQV